jgi:PleD family two-component response regulator
MRRFNLEPTLFKAGGCAYCNFSGYVGRLALMEFLNVSRELRDKIAAGSDAATMLKTAETKGDLKTLLEDAMWHLSRGDTSLDEVSPHVSMGDANGPEPLERPLPPASSTSRKILVADDDPVIRTILRTILSSTGLR